MPFKPKKRLAKAPRSRTIVVNLTRDHHDRLRQLADDNQTSMSALALEMLEYGRVKLPPRPQHDKDVNLTFWTTDDFYNIVKKEAKKRRWPVRSFVREILVGCIDDVVRKGA